jgi:hypothetical protein
MTEDIKKEESGENVTRKFLHSEMRRNFVLHGGADVCWCSALFT